MGQSTDQQTINPFAVAQRQFDLTADRLNLSPGLRSILREPHRALTVQFPVKMDDGSVRVFTGYRVPAQHEPRPGQGRHPLPPGRDPRRGQGPVDVDDLEVRDGGHSLRRRQGRRHRRPQAAQRVRAGGPHPPLRRARSASSSAPSATSRPRTSTPTPRRWPGSWTPTPCTVGYTVPAVVTGKPLSLGGSEGRNEATARGCVFTIVDAAHELGIGSDEDPHRHPGLRQRGPDRLAAHVASKARRSWA